VRDDITDNSRRREQRWRFEVGSSRSHHETKAELLMRCRALLNERGEPFDLPTVAARNTIETVPARHETRFAADPLNAPL
jgi:hypothetical protein